MPKLIDYPRTSYTGAWELAEIVDDTGGKCAIDTAARKLNRKVSGSFKAIIGSAVKFGLMTSKRELLTTTTLFRRIKHAYDKAEELQFHREAFLTPPLFTQLCRKFRNRELPVQMLDVMLIREFGVEEINAQSVAKAFVDGCRMCGLLDERNIIADIDALSNNRAPRRELASPTPTIQPFAPVSVISAVTESNIAESSTGTKAGGSAIHLFGKPVDSFLQSTSGTVTAEQPTKRTDAVASLFGLAEPKDTTDEKFQGQLGTQVADDRELHDTEPATASSQPFILNPMPPVSPTQMLSATGSYQMQMSGPGINTLLDISDEDDVAIAIALLEKIRRQMRAHN